MKACLRSLGLGQKNLFLLNMLQIDQQDTVAMSHYVEHGNELVRNIYYPGLLLSLGKGESTESELEEEQLLN